MAKEWPTPHQRIMSAAAADAGVYLCAREVRELSLNQSIRDKATLDDHWSKPREVPTHG